MEGSIAEAVPSFINGLSDRTLDRQKILAGVIAAPSSLNTASTDVLLAEYQDGSNPKSEGGAPPPQRQAVFFFLQWTIEDTTHAPRFYAGWSRSETPEKTNALCETATRA
ncbi:hypothetical protein VC36_07080 [Pseudomonas marginalis]|nr:hypothetical protein VC36_07080 [Pseudomonas marginalis]